MDLHEALYTTRAMRRVKPDQIPYDIQARILDAAIRAPSGGNQQNWRFLLLDDPAKKAALADVLKRINKALIWSTTHASQYAKAYAAAFRLSSAIAQDVVSQGSTELLPLTTTEITKIQKVSTVMSSIGGLTSEVNVAANSDATAYTAADEASSAKS